MWWLYLVALKLAFLSRQNEGIFLKNHSFFVNRQFSRTLCIVFDFEEIQLFAVFRNQPNQILINRIMLPYESMGKNIHYIYSAHSSSTTEVLRMVSGNISCWDGCVMTPNNDVFRLTSVTSKCSPKIDFYKLVQLESHLWFINVQGGFEIIELLKTELLATYFHKK